MKDNILVIEDEDAHYLAIEQRLKEAGFDVERLESINKHKLYNYKALHQESNVIVVDLNLNQSASFQLEEGLKLVRDELWPVDRTTVFIIFSRHLPKYLPVAQPTLGASLEPHWCYVHKRTGATGNILEPGCLDTLAGAVENACRVTPAFLEAPRHEMASMIQEYDIFTKRSRSLNTENAGDGPRMSIIQSVDLLDQLSRSTHAYARAGKLAEHVSLAVFGSFGRLESRKDSDVELCAYYSRDDKGLSKSLAVMFWNRATKSIQSLERKFEGASLLTKNKDGLLRDEQVDEDLPNRFLAAMPIKGILSASAKIKPHIRNRHLQVLTEARPVFNPKLLDELKRALLRKTGGVEKWGVIGSQVWQNLFVQFFTDTKPEKLTEAKDNKAMVLRVFNLMILRTSFARHLCLPWNEDQFLREMTEPGILKLMRFSNWWRDNGGSAEVTDDLDGIIQHYISIWNRFDQQKKLHEDLRKLGYKICDFMEKLQIQDQLRFIQGTSCEWIWSTAEMRGLLGQL